MAGILNKTARQFNLKCIGANGNRVTVRVAPGFNVMEDKHWEEFLASGTGKSKREMDPYVKSLQEKGDLEFGSKVDDMIMERDPDTKAKSKSEPTPKKAPKSDD